MEIHSSSLYIAPTSQKTSRPADISKSATETNKADTASETPASTPEQFADAATQLAKSKHQQVPLDARTAKALDTYNSTFKQLPQQQITATITGVDFYA